MTVEASFVTPSNRVVVTAGHCLMPTEEHPNLEAESGVLAGVWDVRDSKYQQVCYVQGRSAKIPRSLNSRHC